MFSVFKYNGDMYERVFDDNELIHAELRAANCSVCDNKDVVFSIYDTTDAPHFICYYKDGKRFDESSDSSIQE